MSADPRPRVVLYARISEDTTGDGLKVADQLARCRKHAADQGWTVVDEITDNDVSALKGAHRPGYARVLEIVRAGEIEHVVVWQSSRLLRNRRERAEAIELFGTHRVGIIAVKGISFDLSTAYGRGQAGLMGEFDTMESEVKAERITAAAAERAARGCPSGALGYGWTKHDKTAEQHAYEHPGQAAVVREIVDRLLSGEALRAVTASLNERGEPCPEAAWWDALTVEEQDRLQKRRREQGKPPYEPPREWGKTAVKKLAMRESNVAVRVHHRGRDTETRYQGCWPPLIDQVKHHRITRLLTEPARRKNGGSPANPARPGARRHLLSWGVGECGVCGAHLSLHTRATNRYGKPVIFYRCDAKGCVGRNQAALDNYVRDVAITWLSRPDALGWLMGDEAEAKRLTDRVQELSDLLEEAADDYAAKRITRPVFLRLCGSYQADLESAQEDLRRVNTTVDLDVLKPLAGPEAATRWDAMAVSQRRSVLETIGMRVIVNRSARRGPGFDPESVDIGFREV